MILAAHPERYVRRINNIFLTRAFERTGPSFLTTDFLRRMSLSLDEQEAAIFFGNIYLEDLLDLLQNPPTSNAIFDLFKNQRFLPTPQILAYIKKYGAKAQALFESEAKKIANGGFDLENPLHVELEYSRHSASGFAHFKDLPWIEGKEVILNPYNMHMIERTAEEAIRVFNFIKENKRDKACLVVGNKRYGAFFVIDPLKPHLEKIGAKVIRGYIASTSLDVPDPLHYSGGWGGVVDRLMSEYVDNEKPDVFIIDGTIRPVIAGLTRFSAAMWGYIKAFQRHNSRKTSPENQYALKFWAPEITERFFVGRKEYIPATTDAKNLVTIISSTGIGEDLSGAYFDDPEIRAKSLESGFTSKGFTQQPTAPSEQAYVAAVQSEMQKYIDRHI